jgi:8-oxo-dGTP pyrophosphatase MutT (NUDIX family)
MQTAGLVCLANRKILLAFSKTKQAFYLPGGKLESGEDSRAALIRELREELHVELEPAGLTYYTHIRAPAFGEGSEILMEQDCFRHDLEQVPEPGAEIGEIRYFDTNTYRLEPEQVPGVLLLLDVLKQDDLID